MRLIKTEEAVGHVLCHDITQIIKGVTKDAVFRKGHIVREEDIPVLFPWEKRISMSGRSRKVSCMRMKPRRFCAECARGQYHPTEVKEGKD